MAARVTMLDRVIGWWSPDAGLRRRRSRMMLARAYEGAARTDGWRPRRAGASANTDHAADARELRIRARALVQNVPYISRGLQALVSATIGTGIEPRFDGADAEPLNGLWTQWVKVADADGIFDLYGLQAAAYRAMVQDGEVLIRRRKRRPTDNLPVPMQLQLLEIDWLDSSKNSTSRTGNTIINGVEYDALGKPAAYWLYEQHPGESRGWFGRAGTSKRIDAADIIHLFAPTRPGQGRGISRLASIIARTRDLMLYEDAELQRKNLETRLGIVVSGDPEALNTGVAAYGSAASPGDDGGARVYGDLGVLPSGGITEVPPGMTMTAVEPKPAAGFVDYCKFNLHLIAAGFGVPYESMTGDMVEVNFSSARIRQIEFRRDTEQEQWLVVIPRLCERIASWFTEAAELIGKARVGAKRSVDWSTPSWDYVNPQQDVAAEVQAIASGLLSPSEALRRRGYKPDQVFAEIGRDFTALQKSGALELMRLLLTRGADQAPPPDDGPAPKKD
jgi:lambda family phage portal protein